MIAIIRLISLSIFIVSLHIDAHTSMVICLLYQSIANNYFEEYAKRKVHVAIVAIIVIRIINVRQMLNVLPAKHARTDSVAQIVSIVTVHAGCLKFLPALL